MRKKIYIPKKQFNAIKPPKAVHQKFREEKIELGSLKEQINVEKLAKLINLAFVLADIQESLIIDVENEIKKSDPSLSLDVRNSVERIKIHTRNLVDFVDKKTNESFSGYFGEVSDEIRDYLFKKFEI